MKKLFQTDRMELAKFARLFLIVGPLVGGAAIGFGFWKGHDFPKYAGSVMLAMTVWACAALATHPIILLPVYMVFTAIGNVMEKFVNIVVSFVVLSLVYFLMLTPIALFFRLVGRDRLKLRFDPQARSYWEPRADTAVTIERYKKQY